MDVNQLIPPLLQPYKAYITLAVLIIVYIIRPAMPPPADNGSRWYLFAYNVVNVIAGNYGKAAPTAANLPPAEAAKARANP